jgi:hypothetical protein
VVTPTCGDTRTETDFAAHIAQTVASVPHASRWHFVVDNLNIPMSEALVRFVAQRDQLTLHLGEKGKSGILDSIASSSLYYSYPPHHRVRAPRRRSD